jgi:predicted kinase
MEKGENKSKKPIIMVCGLLGTGKTTISKFLLTNLKDYTRFNTDEVRRILGFKKFSRKDTPIVNKYMYSRTRELIKKGKGVIFDSAYKLRSARQRVYNLAKSCYVNMLVIQTICSHETAKRRVLTRPKKDKLHRPTNKVKDYERYVRLWQDILPELKDSRNKHVSYIKFDTEKYKVKEILVHSDIRETVKKIKNILSKFKIKNSLC